MTSTPEPDADAVAAATPTLRFEGLPEPVDPARWVTTADTGPVPGSISAGDAFVAAEVPQG